MRAMKSVKLYPIAITTEAEACALAGVGSFIARRMLKGLTSAAPQTGSSEGQQQQPQQQQDQLQHLQQEHDRENVAPVDHHRQASSSPPSRSKVQIPAAAAATAVQHRSNPCLHQDHSPTHSGYCSRPDGANMSNTYADANTGSNGFQRVLLPGAGVSIAANLSALRGGIIPDDPLTPDVTPRRPTSRARREPEEDVDLEGVGRGRVGALGALPEVDTDAPRIFCGRWEAVLIVDNREHESVSVQVTRRDTWRDSGMVVGKGVCVVLKPFGGDVGCFQ